VEREATGLLRSLVHVADDLSKLRSWSPRKFMALHRAEQTIERYRKRHLNGEPAIGANGAPAPGSNGAAPGSTAPEAPIRSRRQA
jgi:hypothetical protein